MTLAFLTFCLLLQSLTPEVIEHAQAGAAAQKQGQFEVAIREFKKVTELQPASASGHANLGDAYFQNGNYSAAIPELEEALKLNPKLLGTHQMLGVARLVQGDAAGALPHLEQTHTPELLGLAYLETGSYGTAIMALKASLERKPDDADLLYYYGQATAQAAKRTREQLARLSLDLKHQKQLEQRPPRDVEELEKALAKQPNDPDLLFDFQRAASAASKDALDKLRERDGNSARAHQVNAEAYVELNRLREAEAEYAQALRLQPYMPGLHLALGNVLELDRKEAGAIIQFQAETELRPLDVKASYRLAAALLNQGNAKDALTEFARADQLRPGTPQILLGLGEAAVALKDTGRAEQSWKSLLAIDSQSAVAARAHFGLAAIYREAGKTSQADSEMAAYQKLINEGKN